MPSTPPPEPMPKHAAAHAGEALALDRRLDPRSGRTQLASSTRIDIGEFSNSTRKFWIEFWSIRTETKAG